MSADLYLKNGQIITEDGAFHGGVVVENGKIIQLVKNSIEVTAKETIDLNGRTLLPGLVDEHVHFNEPGRAHWEGFKTGSMAAAAGGITTFFDMPLNANPPTINLANLQEKRRAVISESVVDYALWGGLVNDNTTHLPEMNDAGVIGFKAFMSDSGMAEFKRVDDDVLVSGLELSREMTSVIAVHAENDPVTRFLANKMRASGRTEPRAWGDSRPSSTELEAIRRASFWAGVTGGKLHIMHVSIPEGIQAIHQSRQSGISVYSETCPHYLFFDEIDFERIGPEAKCSPPLRSKKDVDELWECVLNGLVDTIGSDHSPCTQEDKKRGVDDIWKAWGGISGIQTMLPVLLTEGVHRRGLSLPALCRLVSGNPARIYGLYPQKGAICLGADADLVIVDLNEEWTLNPSQLFYKNKHSPYIGLTFKGRVKQVLVRGKTVFHDGEITIEPGYGKLLSCGVRFSPL